MGQAIARQLGDFFGQQHRWRCNGFEEGIVKWQFAHLLCGHICQFVTAIANIDAPQACHAIQYAIAIAIKNITAFGMGHDAAAAHRLNQLIILLGREMVCDIKALEFSDIIIAGHGRILCDNGPLWATKTGNAKGKWRGLGHAMPHGEKPIRARYRSTRSFIPPV